MKKGIFFLVAFLLVLTGCNKTNNTSNSSKDNVITNSGNGSNNNESTADKPSSFLYESQLNGAIRQEQNGNDINIIVERDKESVKVDELFSYSADHLIEIYSSSGVYINQANKEVTLNIGFNKFQVAFKNLKNYSEIIYNFNIFRDPGTVTRKVNQYDVKKEMTKSMQDNGLPSYKFKFYYPYNEYVTYDGIKVPALITECNIQIQFSAYFFIDSNNFLPGSYSPHQHTEQLLLNYEFNDVSDVYEVVADFPIEFWNDVCSRYPFTTLDNSKQGIYERNSNGLYVYTGSYITLTIDYSKFEFN